MNNKIELEKLAKFLDEASKNTYANPLAPKTGSTRDKSEDYHYDNGEYAYHDTYFGGRNFMGEEIIYKDQKPIWGANYYGFVTSDEMGTNEIYNFLRKALMEDSGSVIPVRGPVRFENDNWLYEFAADGRLDCFTGEERIKFNGKEVYKCYLHGGLII